MVRMVKDEEADIFGDEETGRERQVHVGMCVQVFRTADGVPHAGQVKAVKKDGMTVDLVVHGPFLRQGEHLFDVCRRKLPRLPYGWDFIPG